MSQIASDVSGRPTLGPEGTAQIVGKSPRRLFWDRFKQDRVAFVGLGFIILLFLLALLAPIVSEVVGHGPEQQFKVMEDEFGFPKGPTGNFYFGADNAARDLFIRVVYGTRTSLQVAVFATGIAVVIGVTLGLVAGFFRGWIDTVISRMIDIVLSLPLVLFAVGIAAACSTDEEGCRIGWEPLQLSIKPGLGIVVGIIALFSWPYIARIVRGNTLTIREKEFIEASRSLGAGNIRIMTREVLPNLVAPIIVYATLVIPNNIVFEAALSFLGLGVPDRTPSWGAMLDDGSRLFDEGAWWMIVFPGLFLVMTTLAFNLVGDGLRDALDPKSAR
ncbi:MAG: ABC transporter permease [Actinomycetota bacterium]|nr:ABC transporter permease [Actinomycetota bacterium]